jgi:hypothetical protein
VGGSSRAAKSTLGNMVMLPESSVERPPRRIGTASSFGLYWSVHGVVI